MTPVPPLFSWCAAVAFLPEGTTMLKVAPTAAQLPAQGTFVPLNLDGESLPSDWYLRLAGEGGKMLRREIPLASTRPINP